MDVTPADDGFFARLPPFAAFEDSVRLEYYRPLPADWFVAIAEGSTRAIEAGRYKEVNALGVACIVAAINAVRPFVVPYVFGGDGATLCVPPVHRLAVASALVACRTMAEREFGLGLRVGLVPMSIVQSAGREILVGRYRPSEHHQQAMFLGNGLSHAEALIKAADADNPWLLPDDPTAKADFTGFECRWNEVPSPHGETVSLLVQIMGDGLAHQEAQYRRVLRAVSDCYGGDDQLHPMREDLLQLATATRSLATEVRIRGSRSMWWSRLARAAVLRMLVAIGRRAMTHGWRMAGAEWGGYKRRLIRNTDHRKIDEVLRMVIAGTSDQRERLRRWLDAEHADGRLVYGIHVATSALVTCVIGDYDVEHIHFLDASGGGYALAAKAMKAQLRVLRPSSQP